MEKKIISMETLHLKSDELSPDNRRLVDMVSSARKKAFAPYSNFHVGAGVLLDNGEIITSTNQESEVYPSGICAERSLLYFIQANYSDRRIVAMAITSPPCGACRQVMCDTEKRNAQDIPVILIERDDYIYIERMHDLLPITFSL